MMEETETIKIFNDNEVRRVVISKSTSFSKCIELIKNLFPVIANTKIHLLWKDEEQDYIIVSTNEEFQEARNVMKSVISGIPKFVVKVIKDEIKEVSPNPSVPKFIADTSVIPDKSINQQIHTEKIHSNVECDECHMKPIVGVRYKCAVRHNFDLCAKCEDKNIQPYPMIKIFYPRQRPKHEQMQYKMANTFVGPTILQQSDTLSTLEQSKLFKHPHIKCDECFTSPIVGARFKCTTRNNFDLCANCEIKKIQPYPMIKIYDPKHNPSFMQYKMKCFNNSDVKWRDRQIGKADFVAYAMQDHSSTCSIPAATMKVEIQSTDTGIFSQSCDNNIKPAMRFVRDVTFPDGSLVAPREVIHKIWRVRNDGALAWPVGIVLTSAGGDDVAWNHSGGIINILSALNVGEEHDLAVNLTAPVKPGRYVSYFRLQTKEGRNFGQRLWADFIVTVASNTVTTSVVDTNVIDNVPSNNDVIGDLNEEEKSLNVLKSIVGDKNDIVVANEDEEGNWVKIQDEFESATVESSPLKNSYPLNPSKDGDDEDEEPLFYPLHSSICYDDDDDDADPSTQTDVVDPQVGISGGSNSSKTASVTSISGDYFDEDNYSRWKKELALLLEMGFSDVHIIIPLLEEYLKTPAPANTAGLQQVVATLLRIQLD